MREKRSLARRAVTVLLLCAALCAALCGCGGGSSYAPPVFSSPEPEEAGTRALPGDEQPTLWEGAEDAGSEPLQELRELPEPSPATTEEPSPAPAEEPVDTSTPEPAEVQTVEPAEEAPAPAPADVPAEDPSPAPAETPGPEPTVTPAPAETAADEPADPSAPAAAAPAKPDPNGDYRSVTITDTGKKFHRKDCRFAGYGFPVDIYTAAAAGYEPCKVCTPDPADSAILGYLEWLRVEDRSLYVSADYRPDKIEQEELVSSFIAALGYDGDTGVLTILFHSGHLHAYYQVPREVYAAFRAAEDLGDFYTAHIRGEYPYEQLK